MTLYLIYFKEEDKDTSYLYAYTTEKSIKDKFLSERNKSLFKVKKLKGDDDDPRIKAIMYEYRNCKIIPDVLYDGKTNFEIFMTQKESTYLSESCDEIRGDLLEISKILLGILFKTKILNAIQNIIEDVTHSKEKDNTIPINTFKVFYYLFKNTF